jgi:hypothetical protein
MEKQYFIYIILVVLSFFISKFLTSLSIIVFIWWLGCPFFSYQKNLCPPTETSKGNRDFEVIIVGAGVAGVGCAARLQIASFSGFRK